MFVWCVVQQLGIRKSLLRFKIVEPYLSFQSYQRILCAYTQQRPSQVDLGVKNPPASVGDTRDVGLIPGSGRSSGGEHGNPLQCSCLENPMERGVWSATTLGLQRVRYDNTYSTHTERQTGVPRAAYSLHEVSLLSTWDGRWGETSGVRGGRQPSSLRLSFEQTPLSTVLNAPVSPSVTPSSSQTKVKGSQWSLQRGVWLLGLGIWVD